MGKENFLSIPELAKILGLSRIAVYRQVKNGKIKAVKIGRAYAIPQQQIGNILGKSLSEGDKKKIDKAVRKTVKDYGQVLKKLGRE